MKTFSQAPFQFYTNDGIGLSWANAAARKRLNRCSPAVTPAFPNPRLTGVVARDIVALGSAALVAHVDRLLRQDPIKVVLAGTHVTRIRVCGALDYVIDRVQQRVWAEPAPLSCAERAAKQCPPWYHPCWKQVENVDLLNPLCKPAWLAYIAARPGWFGYAFARHQGTQQQLFVENDEVASALQQVVQRVWRGIGRQQAAVALRHQLAATLTLHIGPRLVNLAMRARLKSTPMVLDARHLALVWRHHQACETMALENPQLLSALAAWLPYDELDRRNAGLPWQPQEADSLPAMRRDMLADGLPPKAWRYLAQHGMKRLLSDQLFYSPWRALKTALKAFHAARWPTPPPRSLLRLLNHVAGYPETFDQASGDGMPGWFWQMACDEADSRKDDARAYGDLLNLLPYFAWLVREFGLKPDHNQQRKIMAWLYQIAQKHQADLLQNEPPAFALWLQCVSWEAVKSLNVVPLLSPGALVKEAIAMHNCVDSYVPACTAETCVVLSLCDHRTGKRVALVSVEKRGVTWVLGRVAGPCNRPVPDWVRKAANQAAGVVRYHHSQRPLLHAPPPGGPAIDEEHILFEDP